MLYTYAVYTAETMRAIESGELTDESAPFDEIDVEADDSNDAFRKAELEALDLYGPGSVLEPMQPGGSGGLVTMF